MEIMWIGFVIAGAGFFALNYANVRIPRQSVNRGPRHPLETRYWSLVKEHVGRWPLYTAAICIPLGIIITFGAIIYNNHLKLR
ncbi:DUF4570 domain-containing protein [Occallatibacter riparius]|uniref:DUF4570 domain-containing protein n=1 Tax=Occallatibacter riparius TaxID=1002689 RepID=A0A9J7BJN3_9BACT|nr:DUF4570 domain-containing protein [Occallatibacter riparius]UWZ82887.1 DUF4570 domain-containing protein [Occallatibacter riparius]